MNREKNNQLLGGVPKHLVIVGLMLIWILPSLGLFITSFRPVQQVTTSGWWTVFSPQKAGGEYGQFCADCHGADGKQIPTADLSDPEIAANFRRSLQILGMLRHDVNGQPHLKDQPLPSAQEA